MTKTGVQLKYQKVAEIISSIENSKNRCREDMDCQSEILVHENGLQSIQKLIKEIKDTYNRINIARFEKFKNVSKKEFESKRTAVATEKREEDDNLMTIQQNLMKILDKIETEILLGMEKFKNDMAKCKKDINCQRKNESRIERAKKRLQSIKDKKTMELLNNPRIG